MKIVSRSWLPILLLVELALLGISEGVRFRPSTSTRGRGSRGGRPSSRPSASRSRSSSPPGPGPRVSSEITKVGNKDVVKNMKARVPLNVDSRWGSKPQNRGRVKDVTNALNKNRGRKGDYIQGHLLNDNLGGSGTPPNMVSMSRSLNARYEKQLEAPMKKFANKHADPNSGYDLDVTSNFVKGNPNPHSVSTRVKAYGNEDFQRKFGREMIDKGHFYDPARDAYSGNFLNKKKSKFQRFPFKTPGGSSGGIAEHRRRR